MSEQITKAPKVLVACEESQAVTIEFRKLGIEAYSCDIIDCSGGHPEWHIKQDVLPLLNGNCEFKTVDGRKHSINGKWDMIIAFPPCTYLTVAGNRWFDVAKYGQKAVERKEKQKEAIKFFLTIASADCNKLGIENSVGIMSSIYRKPTFTYNPYDFEGETECKKTCIWLIGNIKPLNFTQNLPKEKRTQGIWKAHFDGKCYAWNDPKTAILRSKTPYGVAKAMAEQWGGELLHSLGSDI